MPVDSTAPVDKLANSISDLIKAYHTLIELMHPNTYGQPTYSYDQLVAWYSGLGTAQSSQSYFFTFVETLEKQALSALTEVTGELIEIIAEPEPPVTLEASEQEVSEQLKGVADWLRARKADGFSVYEGDYHVTLKVNQVPPEPLAAWEQELLDIGPGVQLTGAEEELKKQLTALTATAAAEQKPIEETYPVSALVKAGVLTAEEAKAHYGYSIAVDPKTGKIDHVSLVPIPAKPAVTVGQLDAAIAAEAAKVDYISLAWPKPEIIYGTPVAPTQFIPMTSPPAVTGGPVGCLSEVEMAKPEPLFNPVIDAATRAKQIGKTAAAKQHLTAAMVEKAMDELWNGGKHGWKWTKFDTKGGEVQKVEATATLTLNATHFVGVGDTLDVNGQAFTVTNVLVDLISGISQLTVTLLPLSKAVKQATAALDSFTETWDSSLNQPPWYAQYNNPKSSKWKK